MANSKATVRNRARKPMWRITPSDDIRGYVQKWRGAEPGTYYDEYPPECVYCGSREVTQKVILESLDGDAFDVDEEVHFGCHKHAELLKDRAEYELPVDWIAGRQAQDP